MKDLLNCPNCGAPITAEKCPYCGSVFLDFAAIQVGAPSYVKFKHGDTYICARLVVTNLDINLQAETTELCDGLGVYRRTVTTGYSCDFHLDAHAVCKPGESLVTYIVKEG